MGFFEPHGRGRCSVRATALAGADRTSAVAKDESSGGVVRPNTAAAAADDDRPHASLAIVREATIVVYTLAHAVGVLRAAARVNRPVILLSAADAGIYAGAGWFVALVETARTRVAGAHSMSFLDCGDEPGAALAAIRTGVEGVIFTGRADVALRLDDIAAQHGVRFAAARPPAGLDLADDFFAPQAAIDRHCAEFLARIFAPR
jgi:hypothetical protein